MVIDNVLVERFPAARLAGSITRKVILIDNYKKGIVVAVKIRLGFNENSVRSPSYFRVFKSKSISFPPATTSCSSVVFLL